MRLESLFLAFSISGGCPSLGDEQPSTDVEPRTDVGLDNVEMQQVPKVDPNPNPDDNNEEPTEEPTELEPVEGLTVFQQFETADLHNEGLCVLSFQTVGVEYDDKCNDCLFAFEVDTKTVGAGETEDCAPDEIENSWLLRSFETDDEAGSFGIENIRLQFHQTVETPDMALTNVLVSVIDVYEYIGDTDQVQIIEETTILAHDESETGRAGVTDGHVWWTLDDGVTRIMASGVFAE